MSPDFINGSLEFVGGAAVLNHCWTLHMDKKVRGVSTASVAFFFVWGVWNLYYYPHLDQFWSFAGAVFITLANLIYVGMLLRYRDGIGLRQVRIFFGKWQAGYRPGDEMWSREDQQVYIAIVKRWIRVTDFFGGLVCMVRGHDRPGFPAMRGLRLFPFGVCRRCGS